jgi:hypothetical protein
MTYLVGELDRAALDSVRFGHVPLRYAFSERAEANAVYVVSVSYGDDGELVSAHRTSIVDVPVDWLPVKDVRLGRD